jgi:hypothetical protein
MSRVMEFVRLIRKEVSVTDQPDLWKVGQGILLECDDEKWLAEIVMTSKNGGSLMIGFNGTIRDHLNYMPVTYHGKGIYRSIIDGTEVRIKPLPKDIFK